MNALTQLINQSLKIHNVTKVELVTQLGYKNTTKGLRKLEKSLRTLKDRYGRLEKIKNILKIEDYLWHAAISDVQNEIITKLQKNFYPQIYIQHTHRLGYFGAYGRNFFLKQFKHKQKQYETISEEFAQAKIQFESYKQRFNDTQGYIYQRTVTQAYLFDNNAKFIRLNSKFKLLGQKHRQAETKN